MSEDMKIGAAAGPSTVPASAPVEDTFSQLEAAAGSPGADTFAQLDAAAGIAADAVPQKTAVSAAAGSEEAGSESSAAGEVREEICGSGTQECLSGTGGGGAEPPSVSGAGTPPLPSDNGKDGDDDGQEEESEGGESMSLMSHLRELRRRLVYSLIASALGFLACWSVVEPIFSVITQPLLAVLPEGSNAMYTTLPEAFFTRMYIAFITGLFAVSPFIFYQIWAFIAPGLYDEEKHFIIPIALVSAVFFVGGALFCYYIVFKYAFAFFVSFATEQIVAMPKISDYLDFVLKLLLAFGLVFEMPIFAFFLSRMGIVTAARMRAVRRYAVLVVFIVAAIMTPPDVVSQLLMAVPMLLLYEISILVAVVFGKKKKDGEKKDEESGEDFAGGEQ